MLIEGTCHKCGGRATVYQGTVSCPLCGDFENKGGNQVEHLLEGTEYQPIVNEGVVVESFGEVPEDFSPRGLSFSLPSVLAEQLPEAGSQEYESLMGRILEHLFGYLEYSSGFPKVETGPKEVTLEVVPLSSHSYGLSQLSEKFSISEEELVTIAVTLKLTASEDC